MSKEVEEVLREESLSIVQQKSVVLKRVFFETHGLVDLRTTSTGECWSHRGCAAKNGNATNIYQLPIVT